MKTNLLFTGILSIVFFTTHLVYAQPSRMIAVVDFMKVDIENAQEYRKLEQTFKKVHKARMEQGDLLNWALYRIGGAGTASEYNAVTVNFYSDNAGLAKHFETSMLEGYSDVLTEEEMKLIDRTARLRDLVKTEVYELSFSVQDTSVRALPKVIWMVYRTLMEDKSMDDVLEIENKMVKPVIEKGIRNGTIEGYFFYKLNYPSGNITDYQLAQLYSYDNMEQMLDYPPTYGKEFAKIYGGMAGLPFRFGVSQIYKAELWQLVECACED